MAKERIYPPELLWIKKNQDILNIFQIESQLGMTQSTMRGFLKGYLGLNEKWWDSVVKWVRAFVQMPSNGAAKPEAPKSAPKKAATGLADKKKGSQVKVPVPKEAPKMTQKTPAVNSFLERRRLQKGIK